VTAERGEAPVAGVPWGADMRLFTARGIPTVMCGTTGIELAHAVDERVRMDEVAALARIIARAVRV
jgi:acetylornithine deacetylase